MELVRGYLRRFVAEETPDVPVFSADLGVERTLPGGKIIPGKRTLYYGTLPCYRGRANEEMLARLVAFVRSLATERANEFIRIRAGAAAINGTAILLPNAKDLSLAALVAAMVSRGAEGLADDMTRLDPILHRVHPLSLPMLLDAEDLAWFPELERDPQRLRNKGLSDFQRQAMHRQPVSAEDLGGTAGHDPAPVGWIVFPEFRSGEKTRLVPAGGAEALFRFAETRLNLHVWGERTLVLMRDLLEETAVSWLIVGSIPEAAQLLMETAPSMVGGDSP